MESIITFFITNKNIFISAGGLIVFSLLVSTVKTLFKRRQQHKEVSQAAADRVRDENLNNVILNSYDTSKRQKEVYVPYDVDYGKGDSEKQSPIKKAEELSAKQTMIQLVEKTELSTRKFVLNPAKVIRIGSDLQENDISILADDIAPHQCEIFSVRDRVFIRNVSSGLHTIIKRKRETAFVDEKGIRLLSGDTIILGKVTYDIMIIN